MPSGTLPAQAVSVILAPALPPLGTTANNTAVRTSLSHPPSSPPSHLLVAVVVRGVEAAQHNRAVSTPRRAAPPLRAREAGEAHTATLLFSPPGLHLINRASMVERPARRKAGGTNRILVRGKLLT